VITMRAAVLLGPRQLEVRDVPIPVPGAGEALVQVDRVGVCGTDVELYTGEMAYLHNGHASYPLQPGHEWCGRVVETGPNVEPAWQGQRVTGDTMLGDGTCGLCRRGRQHLCANREEIGIRRRPGALAEFLTVPVRGLHRLPDTVDATLGALVEPGGNAYRAVQAAGLASGDRLLVIGPGTIGLLVAHFAQAQGAEVHLLGLAGPQLEFAISSGFTAWTRETLPSLAFDAVVEASTSAVMPAAAVDLVVPGGRVVYIGLAADPSLVDSRALALNDITAVGVLSASPGLTDTIRAYRDGSVDPRALVAATIGLDDVAAVLAGERPAGATAAPKIHVDPRMSS
jgi:2-desacetyl-2-hydroxyethyl bacteriochlorophyllide A dehydrogenase